MPLAMTIPDRFRQQCRLLRIATLVVFCGLFLLLGLGAGGLPWFPSRADGDTGTRLLLMLVRLLPGLTLVSEPTYHRTFVIRGLTALTCAPTASGGTQEGGSSFQFTRLSER